ncbi:hypothetical protein [Nocardiopsis alborubida]|uniref:Uncharacterized protein n=1 Tax=Nocardiopsis alborubida TaxID=146802 RepID=A0A7X6M8F5_9ACTN|nr:hypothetical protein [Nocardiopsis alborubida]NKY96537.1 hypothetical protein [Nocardiopsis alborubida]
MIAWVTGFFSRLAVGVADFWGRLLASIDGDLLTAVGTCAAMLAIILVVIMAFTNN